MQAWQQLGVVASPSELAASDPDELMAAFATAPARGLSPELDDETVASLVRELQAEALRRTLDEPLRRDGASLAELLVVTSVSEADGAAILRRLRAHEGVSATFWPTLAADPKLAGPAARLRSGLELGALVEYRRPVLEALLAQRAAGDFRSARDLVGRDAGWWARLLRQAGERDADGVADRLVGNVARAFPTTALADRLGRENDADIRKALGTASTGLGLLLRHRPNLDLRATPVPHLLATTPELLRGLPSDERLQLGRDLARLQRLFRLVEGYDQLRVLVREGFGSAQAIRRACRRGFTERIAPHLGPLGADLVYRRAACTAASALDLWARFSPAVDRTPMTVLHPQVANIGGMFGSSNACSCRHCGSVFGPAAYFVDLLTFLSDRRIRRGRLGSLPVGPPGLRPVLPDTALDVLLARRPDLAEIELTCENADILVPVVDLVTEVLESAVAPLSVPAGAGGFGEGRVPQPMRDALARVGVDLAAEATVEAVEADRRWVIRQPGLRVVVARRLLANGTVFPQAPLTVRVVAQSAGDTAELAAYPRFVSGAAYAELATADRPWTLPFHLGLAEIRATLQQLGSSRLEMMEVLARDPEPAVWRDPVVAIEQLGMSRHQVRLVAEDAPGDGHRLWGVQFLDNRIPDPWTPSITVTGSFIDVLRHVSVFLDRSGLTYADLLRLLETWFVNPPQVAGFRPPWLLNRPPVAGDRPIRLIHAERCDPTQARLDGLQAADLPRIHRFVRLWRALGWSMNETDLAVHAFQPSRTSVSSTAEPVLVQLAQLQRLRARLGLPVETLLSFWGPMTTRTYRDPLAEGRPELPSLFDRVFSSRVTAKPAASTFTLDAARTELAGKARPLSGARAEVCSALGLTPDELDQLLAEPEFAGEPLLNLAALSHLHRSTVLARALDLPIASYLVARAVIGDPFAVPDGSPADFHPPESTLRFVAAIDAVRDAGASIHELDDLLRHRLPAGAERPPERDAVDRLLLDLLDSLRSIGTDAARRSHLLSTLADRLELTPAVTEQLLETVLPSLTDPARGLVDDLLAAVGGGLTAHYVDGPIPPDLYVDGATPPAGRAMRRTDREISFDWTAEPPPAELSAANFSARWAGGIHVEVTGTYTLTIRVAGRAQLSVGGRLLINHDPDDPETATATVELEAGLFTDVELTWQSTSSTAALKVEWTTPRGVTEPVPASAFVPEDARRGLARLARWARLVRDLGFSAKEMLILGRRGAGPGWLAPTDLPVATTSSARALFPRWRRLAELSQLTKRLPAGALFELMDQAAGPATTPEFLDDLAERTGWNRADLDFLRDPRRWDLDLADFRDERLYVRLAALFGRLAPVGTSVSDAWAFTRADDDPGFADPLTARQAVRARREDDRWVDAAALVRDRLREPQRQALVAHLVDSRHLTDAAALSEQLLLDVEMSPCATTTRLAHAIGSVQTFVERCRLGLEHEISADEVADPEWRQWEWMKNYRVWEASRKVFLHPENWIEPDLRDDKSPFFRELESELLQGDLTDTAAEAAIERYLDKLHEVARLDVQAICEEPAHQPGAPTILHVVGRTSAPPHVYHYRRRVGDGSWTAWEKVDVDIEGDHLMAVVANHRITLLWPVITERTNADPVDEALPEQAGRSWEITLAWSEYRCGVWSPKKVSREALSVPLYLQIDPGSPATMPVPSSGGGAFVWDLSPGEPAVPATFIAQDIDRSSLYFEVDDASGDIEVSCHSRPASAPQTPPDEEEIDAEEHKDRIDDGIEAGAGAYRDEFLGVWGQIPFLDTLTTAPYTQLRIADRPSESWAEDIGRFAKDAALLAYDIGVTAYAAVTAAVTLAIPLGFLAIAAAPVTAAIALDFGRSEMTRKELKRVLKDLRDTYKDDHPSGLVDLKRDLDDALLEEAKKDDPFGGDGSGLLQAREVTGVPELARKALAIASAIVEAVPPMSPSKRKEPEQSAKHFAWGSFTISCGDQVHVQSNPLPEEAGRPLIVPDTDTHFNTLLEAEHKHNDALRFDMGSEGRTTVLAATPGRFHLVRTNPLRTASPADPFVYQDPGGMFLAKRQGPPPPLQHPGLPGGLDVPDLWARSGLPAVLSGIVGPELELPGLEPFRRPRWSFETFEHPLACQFREALARSGVRGLLDRAQQEAVARGKSFQDLYRPTWLSTRFPARDVDFAFDGAYASYNWELFFHIPFLIATQLGRNQRFADAQKWFHTIFDPTARGNPDGSDARYWRTLPFFETTQADHAKDQADRLLKRLAAGSADPSLDAQVEHWRANPFSPHRIARLRSTAYQKAVVMRYLDNLIEWADQLFRRETMEDLNEAAGLYAQAARILGPRPQLMPPADTSPVRTWSGLARDPAQGTLEDLEVFVTLPSTGDVVDEAAPRPGFPDPGVFCVPPNDRLLRYWDTVADRQFRIRNCTNLDGTVRQLPPFAPPIDPGLLVRAAAAGVDVASILDDAAAPAPPYRFTTMHQMAMDLCAEVRSLGGSLLSALEKRDAETLAALSSTQQTGLLRAVRSVREQQLAEAKAGREALELSRRVVQERFDYYDTVAFLNPMEAEHLQLLGSTLALQHAQSGIDLFGNLIALVPNTKVGLPTTAGVTFGGDNLAQAVRAFSSYLGSMVSILGTTGSLAATMGGHARRADDWKLQRNLAEKELTQLDKQLAAAEIRETMTEMELANHDRQLADARQVESFLKTKYTGEELFGWMSGQLATLHFQAYRLAYDVASRAQAALRVELGDDAATFVQFGHWDSLRKGLMAGDRLALDLRRMAAAYLERNVREAELTRHVSLALLSPRELIRLREHGTCVIEVPEALFDLDHPGHYMRRIKSVSVTVPCVTGPYTGIPGKLTLVKCSTRLSADADQGYQADADDPRMDSREPAESIFLSGGQADAGLFEANLRDERFLPFEGHGVISTWKLELPTEFRPFDYRTISDVILHIRYTARDGKAPLRSACLADLQSTLNAIAQPAGTQGFARLFALGQESPDRFALFRSPPSGADRHELTISITKDRFPFLFRDKTIDPRKVEVFLRATLPSDLARSDIKLALGEPGTNPTELEIADESGLLHASTSTAALGVWTLQLWQEQAGDPAPLPEGSVIEELFVLCYYGVT